MEVNDTPTGSRAALDPLYSYRIEWANTTHVFRKNFKGGKRPSDPSKASDTLQALKELAELEDAVDAPMVVVDHKYHPGVASLESLRKIFTCRHPPITVSISADRWLTRVSISDLRTETHARGSILLVRRIGSVTQTWARLLFAIQDETGNTCLVTFNQHMRDVPAEEFIPKGAVVAIKEPFVHMESSHPFKDPKHSALRMQHMFWVVRVDHPADLVVLPPSDSLVPTDFRTSTTLETAIQWKEKGNVAFATRRFLEAQRCYTEGIRLSAKGNELPKLAADLFRNRARTGLSLRFFDSAKSDALKAVSLMPSADERAKELNTKALFRAASAAYSLSQFEESRTLLTRLFNLTPTDEAGLALSKKIKFRLREMTTGDYNFSKIRERLQSSGSVDAASYLARTELRKISDGGTGLFALQDIQAGDVVFCEKAFVAATPQDASAKPADLCSQMAFEEDDYRRGAAFPKYDVALWTNMVDKVTRNKSTMSWLDSGNHKRPTLGELDDVFLLDQISNEKAMMMTHSATNTLLKRKGFWIHASHINHSCMPNTARGFIGDLVVFRATRDIKSNEELLGSFSAMLDDFDEFQALHQTLFKKLCDCAICVAERQTPPMQRAARQEILKSIKEFRETTEACGKHTPETEYKKAFDKGVILAKRLSATYDNQVFTDVMPRRGLGTLYESLQDLSSRYPPVRSAKQIMKRTLDCLLEGVKASGCEIAINAAGDVSFVIATAPRTHVLKDSWQCAPSLQLA